MYMFVEGKKAKQHYKLCIGAILLEGQRKVKSQFIELRELYRPKPSKGLIYEEL
jgi:hypothetical protein